MQPINVESLGPGAPARLGPATLLCPALDLRDSAVVELLQVLCESGLSAGLVPLLESSGELVRRVVASPRRHLVVLCKTSRLDVAARLRLKHAFVRHARPSHWLTTARLEQGVELAAYGVLEVAQELFLGEPVPFHVLRDPGDPSRSASRDTGEGVAR